MRCATTALPTGASLGTFGRLLTDTSFARWFGNSVLIAGVSAAVSVFLSALAAYAFSRMRFRGRRVGLLALLLIQMFPQFLAIVAMFLMFSTITDLWPAIGFNQASGLIQVRDILGSIDWIAFVEFTHQDVVRHKLVQRIVEAYKQHAEETGTARKR